MADEGELVAERYRVLARVGQGAMGVVWRAEDDRLQREVALKQVSLPAGADDQSRDRAHRRVFREGRMIARLHHPHAIAVYDVVEHDDRPWLVMEYLASRSLAEVLVGDGPLDPQRVARLGRQVADALAAAHQAGIVHRDVKPGNVLLADDGLAKVTDFGIARAVDDVTLTSTGMMAGTPAYLAPEVARGGAADFRSDVYSLGSTLYAALEGAPPFGTGDNPLAVLHRVASGEYARPTPRGPITPLVEALLRPGPAERPDMRQVRDDLARLVSTEAGTEEGPVTPVLARPVPAAKPGPSPAPARAPAPDHAAEHAPDRGPDHAPEHAPEHGPDHAPDRGPDHAPDHAPAPVRMSVTSAPAASVSSTASPPAAPPAASRAAPPPAVSSPPPAPASGAPPAPGGHGASEGAVAVPPDTRPATTAPVGTPGDGPAGPGGPDEPPTTEEPARGRRWPWLVAAAAVVAVVAVIALAALLSTTADRPGASVPGGTAAPESSAPEGEGTGGATGSAAGDGGGGSGSAGGGSTVAPSGSPEEQARQQAIIDYYGLIPDQLDEGWRRLTPSFQQQTAGGFESYRAFWGQMQQVTVRGVSSAGGDEVDATVTYRYADGREVDERTVFRLVFADGVWKIDGQRQAS